MKTLIFRHLVILLLFFGFTLSVRSQTFDFNTGTTQGWTLDQMYETSTQNKITPYTSFTLSNQQNQLAASVSPLLIGDASIKSYDIYLESPDISSDANWQNVAGYSVDIKRTLFSMAGEPPNVYFAQLQLKIIDISDNNKEKLFAEYNGSNFVFHEILLGQNYHFVWKPSFLTDPNYKVKNVRIRFTGPGDPGGTGGGEYAPKGSWVLDNVKAESGTTSAGITVDVPNGGEVWEANTPRFIRWHTQNFTDPVKIEYSTDGGSNYSTIIASTQNDGTYEWTVPNAPSNQCLVKISDVISGSPFDISDANFIITSTQAIFVDVPSGGESWEAETPRYIVWHNHLFSDPVKIEYSTDGGSSYTTIVSSTSNTGSYKWEVPNTPSTQCRVRISDAGDAIPSNVSSSNFTITATESITLDVPNGGDDWNVGSPRFIVWHNHLFSGPVKIEYSTDGGNCYSTVVQSAPNSGSYQWKIPDNPSANCLIKISDAADGNPSDESNNNFKISSSFQTNTNSGSNILVSLGSGVNVTFNEVAGEGATSMEINLSGKVFPEGYAVLPITEPLYYNISTTADFSNNVEVVIEYNPEKLSAEHLAGLTLQSFDETSGEWSNITTTHDISSHTIYGSANHLSEFAVMTPGAEQIMVISPNGYESWAVGSQHEIQWASSNFTGPVRIEYSTDGNWTHLDVVNSTDNDGSYLWTIPNTPSDMCVVIISDTADFQPADISDAVFKITTVSTESITLIAPNGGENWLTGSEQEIKWISYDFADPVRIELSIDGGSTYESIIDTTENDGSFILPVPNTPSVNCLIKISDVTDDIPSDTSDAVFTIFTGIIKGHIIVENTADSGFGSLRDAIIEANTNVGIDTIVFNIPKGVQGYDADIGIWTISPASPLPYITDAGLVINGNSQKEFIGEDSNLLGPEIIINGSQAGISSGFGVFADNIEIDGLVIKKFKSIGIDFNGIETGRIANCYIGTDHTGADTAGNYDGIELRNGTNNIIVTGNVISGNKRIGIFIVDSSSYNFIHNNIIGLDCNGTASIGNTYDGIAIERHSNSNEVTGNHIGGNNDGINIYQSNKNFIVGNIIGTNESWELDLGNVGSGVSVFGNGQDNIITENIIGYNDVYGVYISDQGSSRNTISRNSISKNYLEGIHLNNGGNTELQPPNILSVNKTEISGIADSYNTIEFFTDEINQGRFYLGSVQSDSSGSFTFILTDTIPISSYITATVTDTAGNTSEFSQPFLINSVAEQEIPTTFKLYQNYPNPFNPVTRINYAIPQTYFVILKVYDILGKEVAILVNEEKQPGTYFINFNAVNLCSGIYFYRMTAGSFTSTKKFVLLH